MKLLIKNGGWRSLCSILWMIFFSTAYGQPAPPGLVTLGWTASTDPAVAGYYVYYGTASGVYTNKTDAGTNTVFTFAGLAAGSTYYFTATCYNAVGIESSFAPEISSRLATATRSPTRIAT